MIHLSSPFSHYKEKVTLWMRVDSNLMPAERMVRLIPHAPAVLLLLTYGLSSFLEKYFPGILTMQLLAYFLVVFCHAKGFCAALGLILIYGVYHTGAYQAVQESQIDPFPILFLWGLLTSLAITNWILLSLQQQASAEKLHANKELTGRLETMIQLEQQCQHLQVELQEQHRILASNEKLQKERTKLKELNKELEQKLQEKNKTSAEIDSTINIEGKEQDSEELNTIQAYAEAVTAKWQEYSQKARELCSQWEELIGTIFLEPIKAGEESPREVHQELKKANQLYAQLREQFAEKQTLLHRTRSDFFQVQTELMRYQRQEMMDLAEESEETRNIAAQFGEAVEENNRLQSQVEELEELLTLLLLEKAMAEQESESQLSLAQ